MTDLELLEFAAKAAGISLHFINGKPKEVIEYWPCDPTKGPLEREWDWDPLTDDGDALRLAAKLNMELKMCNGVTIVSDGHSDQEYTETNRIEYLAATRRAIVRAAAELGRNQK